MNVKKKDFAILFWRAKKIFFLIASFFRYLLLFNIRFLNVKHTSVFNTKYKNVYYVYV